jgi:hypothetical protein
LIRLNLYRNTPAFLCQAGHAIPLRDDEGNLLSPVEAKRRLQAAANPHIENQRPKELIEKPSAAILLNETLEQTLTLLNSFRDNLPESEVDMNDVAEYHRLLNTAASELRCDLREFRIPNTAIKSRDVLTGLSQSPTGEHDASFETQQYVTTQAFKRKLDGLLDFLNRKQS